MICFESKLDCKVRFVTESLCNNGFREAIVRSVIGDKIAHFHKTKVASAHKCPIYLRLLSLVISVIVLLIRSLLGYESVIFLPICMLCFAHVLFSHLVGKMFSPPDIAVLSYILLDTFAVCNTSGEQINGMTQELNNMCLRKYG